jgi:hypothetical protein
MAPEAGTRTNPSAGGEGERLGSEPAVAEPASRATVDLTSLTSITGKTVDLSGTAGATIRVGPPPAAATNDTTRLLPRRPATIPTPRPRETPPMPDAGPPAVLPVERLRFGPGVPAVLPSPAAETSPSPGPFPPPRRRERVLNGALTAALAAVVVWLLWPAGPLHVRQVSLRATPAIVGCEKTADVVATVRTNGRAGHLHYRWDRNDGQGSGILEQSVSKGQHAVDLRLRWAFHGPGTYAARATVQLLDPGSRSATVRFSYHC